MVVKGTVCGKALGLQRRRSRREFFFPLAFGAQCSIYVSFILLDLGYIMDLSEMCSLKRGNKWRES